VANFRHQFQKVLINWIEHTEIDTSKPVLIIGGTSFDFDVLQNVGFTSITLSNFDGVSSIDKASNDFMLCLDAEQIGLANNTFETVFAHAVLHHCRSPHRALCEMLRISSRNVVFMEPNDSMFLRMLTKLRMSSPYEISAVVGNNFISGGVNNTNIPNYLYRWNKRDVEKVVAAFVPERSFNVYAYPYWDFSISESELASRTSHTNIGIVTNILGTRVFLNLLKAAHLLNLTRLSRSQGNRFFCHIEINKSLQPWLIKKNNQIIFNKEFVE